MGAEIAWLLPAAVICRGAGFVITRRAPRTDPARAALILWGGWLAVTAVVFSFVNGIVHPYYTVALAPAIAACIGIGATLLWRNRFDIRAATALSGTVLVSTILAAVLLSRHDEWLPWLRAARRRRGSGGGGAAAGRRAAAAAGHPRRWPALAVAACLAAPAVYSVATAATPHSGAIPSAGPARHGGPGGFGGPGGLLASPHPGPALSATLAADADDFTWAAAVVGSNNAAGYQLASGAPVMAVGGFNGTDPSPTLEEFKRHVADRQIHYFIGGTMMIGNRVGATSGSREAADIAEWVETHYAPVTVDGVIIYDLTGPARGS